MRRAILIAGGTVAGLAALFSYKTHVPGVTALSTPIAPGTQSATSPPVTSPSGTTPTIKPPTTRPSATKSASTKATATKTMAPATTPAHTAMTTAPASTATTKAPAPTHSATPSAPATTKAPAKPSGTFTGPTVNTQYGPVQVVITVSNGQITNASDPDGGDSIGENAIQQLNPEVVQAQSANISAVSGATYTSQGYIESLQQAIDSAGL
jgi:uncharacterized protein with FMN-binding domain